jgi:hypothetical protein
MFFLKEPSIKWQISNPLNHFIFLFRNYSLSHCGAGIHRNFQRIRNPPNTPLRIVAPESAGASGAFEIRRTPRFALWRRNPPELPAHSQSELRPPKGTRAAETGRRCGRARMPLEELGVMLCLWLAWGAQLAQMALQSQREDE